MIFKIQKWGNSLAIRIPKLLAEEIHLCPGSKVDISMHDGHIVIEPIEEDLLLASLLESITDENLHKEQDFGKNEGNEIW
jgi:antitoxin MazE